MSNIKIPTLDSSGWINSIEQSADKLFAYFLASERSQSNVHTKIASLPWIIQRYSNNPSEMAEEVESQLRGMFIAYFDDVSVNVRVQPIPDDDSKLDINIRMLITNGGQRHSLSRLIATHSGSIKKITTLDKE